MTENRADYLTKTEVEITKHRCPNPECDVVYGYETPDGYLSADGFMITDIEVIRGKCRSCGTIIKWYSTDYRMLRMLRGRQK